jgi:hypothetical protein
VQSLPLAHLSVELGHLYAEDVTADPARLREVFGSVAPWLDTARHMLERTLTGRSVRLSTCFLIDDYFSPVVPPWELIPRIRTAAKDCGVRIDYLARESGCEVADGVDLARVVQDRLVDDPPPGTTGARPTATETGWLCNGERTPMTVGLAAMSAATEWEPPRQNGAKRHSVFVDVELWDQVGDRRVWSCAYLAAVWQLLRLGLLRNAGAQVAVPQPLPKDLPDSWDDLPAVMQVEPDAQPFAAYRTMSIVDNGFLSTEAAVRTILSQVFVEREVLHDVGVRAERESLVVPPELVERVTYVFTGPPWRSATAPGPGSAGSPGPARAGRRTG